MTCLELRSAAILLLLSFAGLAQDRADWQALSRLTAGERARVVATFGRTTIGPFKSFTSDSLTVSGVVIKRLDLKQVSRLRRAGWSRGKKAAIGALIGGAGGAAFGAAVGGCETGGFGPCFTRAETGAACGVAGALAGGIIGLLLPSHRPEVIYSVK